MNKENDIKLNGSGYIDPTAYKAIKKVMKDDTNLNFADQLKYIMRIEKLSQLEVANMCGITERTVDKLLSGEKKPSFDDAQKILDSLGYKIDICKENYNCTSSNRTDSGDRFYELLGIIFGVCKSFGFHIEERIVLKDLLTGKIWR